MLAVSGVSGEPGHYYFGAVNGGVWESTNAGRTWRPIFDAIPVGSIGALAVAPSNPRVIYVGTGEAEMRSDIAQGKGLYRSDDAGATWRFVGLGDTQQIGRIQVDPQDAKLAWVAALGHPYGPNAERGVFRTRDGGAHWTKVLGPDANTGAIDVVLAPDDPRTLYAALWQTRRTPWNIYPPSNGPGSGLYRSTDGGDHWTRLTGNGFATSPGRIGLAVAPSDPSRLYALVDADSGGLYNRRSRRPLDPHECRHANLAARSGFRRRTVEPRRRRGLRVQYDAAAFERWRKEVRAGRGRRHGRRLHAVDRSVEPRQRVSAPIRARS